MRTLTFVLSYFNQVDALRRHISTWNSYPEDYKEKLSFSIVDDCSKMPAIKVMESESNLRNLDIHLYRVNTDLFWNVAGARNLGMQELNTEWALLLDMDTLVDSAMLEQLFALVAKFPRHRAYRFNRDLNQSPGQKSGHEIHPAVALIRGSDYWAIGGCDEDFVGHYGCTDRAFWHRARGKLEVIICEDIYLLHEPRGACEVERDSSRNRALFEEKKKSHRWSTDFLRFDWGEVLHGRYGTG